MSWKDLLESLVNDEKNTKQFTDSIIDFFVISIPKVIGKGVSETYSWVKEGAFLAVGSITKNYKQWHDVRMFNKMYKQIQQGKHFCEKDYRGGEVICKHSKNFYDKRNMIPFCKELNHSPNLSVQIKRKGAWFHKGYCACSNISKVKPN